MRAARIPLAVLVALLAACTTLPDGSERAATASRWAATRDWQRMTLGGPPIELTAFGPPAHAVRRAQPLTVYIEGDGLAWLTPTRPSPDPTPLDPLALRLALAQPEGLAAYLARPCQYTGRRDTAQCPGALWTHARFSEQAVRATSQALDALVQRYGATRLHLVGYSGGAALAVLVAARRTDVASLTSVAGNLDPTHWTRVHGLTPLHDSLDPLERAPALGALPQWHFSGERDAVVPPDTAQRFMAHLPEGSRAQGLRLPGFDHRCCWTEQWPALWRQSQVSPAPLRRAPHAFSANPATSL
jgi:dienelactone hydrolase